MPPSPGASPSSASSSTGSAAGSAKGSAKGHGRGPPPQEASQPKSQQRPGRDDGVHYFTTEELKAFPNMPEDRFIADVLRRLDSKVGEWSDQFAAISEARRLVQHAPKAVMSGGHLRKMVALITTLMDSLRSALAKNALLCVGELFAKFGRRMDPELELSLPVILKRAVDTNSFIAEEAEWSLREVCKAASETKLMPHLLTSATNRQPRVRERSIWCVAMLTQQLRDKGPSAGPHGREQDLLRSAAEATNKALGDANADVRHSARVAAIVLVAASGIVVDECVIGGRIASAVIPGIDPASFDVFDSDALLRCAELARTTAGISSVPRAQRLR